MSLPDEPDPELAAFLITMLLVVLILVAWGMSAGWWL